MTTEPGKMIQQCQWGVVSVRTTSERNIVSILLQDMKIYPIAFA